MRTVWVVMAAVILAAPGASFAQTNNDHLDVRRATRALVRQQPSTPSATQNSNSGWENVRALPPFSNVYVDAMNGAAVKGRLRSVTDDALVVETSGGDLRVMRTDVRRVRESNPGKRLLYGFAGVLAGMMAPTAICPSCEGEGHSLAGARAIGAGLGSLMLLPDRTSTIYKAPGR